jgi:hypothetical protein
METIMKRIISIGTALLLFATARSKRTANQYHHIDGKASSRSPILLPHKMSIEPNPSHVGRFD